MTSNNKAISNFIEKYFLHFNAAALVDAAKGYQAQLDENSKMLVSLAGAMSTAELGKLFAEMIRQDKVQIVSCTGANQWQVPRTRIFGEAPWRRQSLERGDQVSGRVPGL